jgi:flagellar basal body rod protein FlgG
MPGQAILRGVKNDKRFYAGASCMVSQQTNLNTIANNIANVSTTAFNLSRLLFHP